MIAALLTALSISGAVPPSLAAVSRVVWVDADMSAGPACTIDAPGQWTCDDVHEPARGVVVLIGDAALAYQCIGVCDHTSAGGPVVRRWGRVVVLVPGAVAPEDLRDIRLTAAKPDRSTVRTALLRFTATEDSTVDIVPLSNAVFWVAGDSTDDDAFLRFDGPAISSLRVPARVLREGVPEQPLYVSATAPFALNGHVQDSTAQDVEDADVEVYEPLVTPSSDRTFESLPMVRVGVARSDANGAFAFESLTPGSYLLSVVHATLGRATVQVTSLAQSQTIRLVPPQRAFGRVLKHELPVPGARVRFVPHPQAFAASKDPRELLAEETITGHDGRFSLALPPGSAGLVQAIAPDGETVRVPIVRDSSGKDISIGDIALPDPHRLTVRLLDAAACSLSAIGPIGGLGLTIVRSTRSGAFYWFEIPEPGDWVLTATCDEKEHGVRPMVISVQASGTDPLVDISLAD